MSTGSSRLYIEKILDLPARRSIKEDFRPVQKYLLAGIGGFLGTVTRLWVGNFIDHRLGARFPYGTFAINLSGCFLIGLLLTVFNARLNVDPAWRYLLPIGFCGAYTTFSTFEYETYLGVQNGGWQISLLYVMLSVVVGFGCIWAGTALGGRIE